MKGGKSWQLHWALLLQQKTIYKHHVMSKKCKYNLWACKPEHSYSEFWMRSYYFCNLHFPHCFVILECRKLSIATTLYFLSFVTIIVCLSMFIIFNSPELPTSSNSTPHKICKQLCFPFFCIDLLHEGCDCILIKVECNCCQSNPFKPFIKSVNNSKPWIY